MKLRKFARKSALARSAMPAATRLKRMTQTMRARGLSRSRPVKAEKVVAIDMNPP